MFCISKEDIKYALKNTNYVLKFIRSKHLKAVNLILIREVLILTSLLKLVRCKTGESAYPP